MLAQRPRLCGSTRTNRSQRQAYTSRYSRCHSLLVVKAASTTASRPADGLQARLAEAPRQPRPDNNDIPRLLTLVQWAITNKIAFSGIRPDVRDGIRGVFATSPLQPGDTLVAVPTTSALTVTPNERCPFPTFVPEVRKAPLHTTPHRTARRAPHPCRPSSHHAPGPHTPYPLVPATEPPQT